MKAILLDGALENDFTGLRIRTLLSQELQTRGWEVEQVTLRDQHIGNCAGDFFCWVRTPGMCNINDDNRVIAEEIVHSDLLVYLTPVTFGGYSPTLKRMVDHQIQNISPYFATINSETHHQKRYDRYSDFLTVGWLPEPEAVSEALFHQLSARNGINFYAKKTASRVLYESQTAAEMLPQLQGLLNVMDAKSQPQPGRVIDEKMLPQLQAADLVRSEHPIRRAVLLVGSPKMGKSSSNALGGYLFEQLRAKSVQVETIQLYPILRSAEKLQNMMELIEASDLLMLAFPLYIDSLPAPVIDVMQKISAYRKSLPIGKLDGQLKPRAILFAALANSGFPESSQNSTALGITERFAHEAGFTWAGGLAMGGGGMVSGQDLAHAGGPAIPVKRALDLAADALARGAGIPTAAVNNLASPAIPGWLYRLFGSIGWDQQAKKYGVGKLLRRKTYSQSG